jgi:hypothetical protein
VTTSGSININTDQRFGNCRFRLQLIVIATGLHIL